MDVAQSPHSCDWLGEPLGLGESQGLTSSCPSWARWIPPTLLHSPRTHQAEASAWLMPPISSANSQSVLPPVLVLYPVVEPITPEERALESQCPHQQRMCSGSFSPPCPYSHSLLIHVALPLSCCSSELSRPLD